MRKENKTYRWLWNGLMAGCLLLLWACGSSSEPDEPKPLEKPVLKLYVYAPNRPIVTRAGGDNVAASDLENEIKSLQVWVFEGATKGDGTSNSGEGGHEGELVGYVNLMNVTPSAEGSEITISDLSDDFIERKPKVNVYVAANVANGNCGQSLEATFKGANLDAAIIGTNYFGLSPTVKEVPANGLPMTGVLKEEAVSGVSPVFRVGSESGVKNVKLVRAVSKVRFVFCKSSDNTDDVAIKNIKLDANVLPNEEYLFLNGIYGTTGNISRVKGTVYNTEADLVTNVTAINSNDSPISYSYDGVMSGQAYEDMIQGGIDTDKLSDVGTFYLRESDRKLTGSIIYNIGVTERTKTFSMNEADDFTRNHTWIVYGYFVSKGDLMLNIVDVKDWVSSRDEEEVHNW